MSNNFFEVKNVDFIIGGKTKVKNVSFSIENEGDTICLLGPSGIGKTTILRTIAGLEKIQKGLIKLNGKVLSSKEINVEPEDRKISLAFQENSLFPHYTVAENVAAVPQLLGWDDNRVKLRCEETLKMVGLPVEEYGARYSSQLSGGQQQRVGVARALAAEPDVILMDEPFGALDPITRAELQEEFKRIQTNLNLTVIIVTHDMTEALLMADRIAVMKDGEVLQIGTPQELLNKPEHEYVKKMVDMPKRRADRLEKLVHSS